MMMSLIPQQIIDQANLSQIELEHFAQHSETFLQHKNDLVRITSLQEITNIINTVAEATALLAFCSVLSNHETDDADTIEMLDHILYEAAFRSGVHVAILNKMVDNQCEYYTSMFEHALGYI